MSKFCENCKEEINENTKFCPNCGNKIGKNVSSKNIKKDTTDEKINTLNMIKEAEKLGKISEKYMKKFYINILLAFLVFVILLLIFAGTSLGFLTFVVLVGCSIYFLPVRSYKKAVSFYRQSQDLKEKVMKICQKECKIISQGVADKEYELISLEVFQSKNEKSKYRKIHENTYKAYVKAYENNYDALCFLTSKSIYEDRQFHWRISSVTEDELQVSFYRCKN